MNELNILSLCWKRPPPASSLEPFCWIVVQSSALCTSKHGCTWNCRWCFQLYNTRHAIVLDLLKPRRYNFFCYEAKPLLSQRKKIKAMSLVEARVKRANAAVEQVCTGRMTGSCIGENSKPQHQIPLICVSGVAPVWHLPELPQNRDLLKLRSELTISEMQLIWGWAAWSTGRESLQ